MRQYTFLKLFIWVLRLLAVASVVYGGYVAILLLQSQPAPTLLDWVNLLAPVAILFPALLISAELIRLLIHVASDVEEAKNAQVNQMNYQWETLRETQRLTLSLREVPDEDQPQPVLQVEHFEPEDTQQINKQLTQEVIRRTKGETEELPA